MSYRVFLPLIVVVFLLTALTLAFAQEIHPVVKVETPPLPKQRTFWQYQCIDTMKYSRDRARQFQTGELTEKDISAQVEKIASLGANCVAIGTPYDNEFVPYLTAWVGQARKNNLKVWFRGNWSGYEGWFDYPRLKNLEEHYSKTADFIATHRDLFQDGDIFTPAPEPENTQFFKESFESDPAVFRAFLRKSKESADVAFKRIGVAVVTSYISQSGGTAKRYMDAETISALENTVTIDHYVKSPDVMQEFISYFHDTFNANVALGEFGAPIPDINGDMNDDAQAKFVASVFDVLAKEQDHIPVVNYWTLNDSSTAVLHDDFSEKPVADVIRNYYIPDVIYGVVVNEFDEPISEVQIGANAGTYSVISGKDGSFSLLAPHRAVKDLVFSASGMQEQKSIVAIADHTSVPLKIILKPENPDGIYSAKLAVYRAVKRVL